MCVQARDRLRSVVNNIAEVESTCDFAPGVGGATSAQVCFDCVFNWGSL